MGHRGDNQAVGQPPVSRDFDSAQSFSRAISPRSTGPRGTAPMPHRGGIGLRRHRADAEGSIAEILHDDPIGPATLHGHRWGTGAVDAPRR
jgi:hypothetical protein